MIAFVAAEHNDPSAFEIYDLDATSEGEPLTAPVTHRLMLPFNTFDRGSFCFLDNGRPLSVPSRVESAQYFCEDDRTIFYFPFHLGNEGPLAVLGIALELSALNHLIGSGSLHQSGPQAETLTYQWEDWRGAAYLVADQLPFRLEMNSVGSRVDFGAHADFESFGVIVPEHRSFVVYDSHPLRLEHTRKEGMTDVCKIIEQELTDFDLEQFEPLGLCGLRAAVFIAHSIILPPSSVRIRALGEQTNDLILTDDAVLDMTVRSSTFLGSSPTDHCYRHSG